MKSKFILKSGLKIHFIGVGGISMSALAKYCKNAKMSVSGSDMIKNAVTDDLQNYGINIFIGHDRKNAKGADVIVYNSAINANNPEYQFAKDNNKLLVKRSELLAAIEKAHNYSIAVSGCHGKTTVTAMLAHIFIKANKHPTCFIGGEDKTYGNFVVGSDTFITEACEYKKNFLELSPDIAVVLNIDNDHLDCYGNIERIKNAYKKFITGKKSVINADDENTVSISDTSSITYGINQPAVYVAKNIRETDGIKFSLYVNGSYRTTVKLSVGGRHNVYNALAAITCAMESGISLGVIKTALADFEGVYRRQEILGVKNGTIIEADYAHHPNEILSVVKSGDFIVFQPHTYSRTKLLLNEFANVLKKYDIAVMPVYAARESYDVDGSGYALYERIKNEGGNCAYVDTQEKLFDLLDKKIGTYKRIMFLGAGDIYEYAKKYFKYR